MGAESLLARYKKLPFRILLSSFWSREVETAVIEVENNKKNAKIPGRYKS